MQQHLAMEKMNKKKLKKPWWRALVKTLMLWFSLLCFHWINLQLYIAFIMFCFWVLYVYVFLFCSESLSVVISAQLVAQEEALRLEEEAKCAAQREAARLARERRLQEVRRHRARPSPPFSRLWPPLATPLYRIQIPAGYAIYNLCIMNDEHFMCV